MNFFGNPSAAKTSPKGGLARQKKWHSSKNLNEETKPPVKFAPGTRRANRKNNLATRSLWYDHKDGEEEGGRSSFGFALRKSSSLDNLLGKRNTGPKSKIPPITLTKDMISPPQYPRRIVGEWSRLTNSKMFEDAFRVADIEEEINAVDEPGIMVPEEPEAEEEVGSDESGDIIPFSSRFSEARVANSVEHGDTDAIIDEIPVPLEENPATEDLCVKRLENVFSETSGCDIKPSVDDSCNMEGIEEISSVVDETSKADNDSQSVIDPNESDETRSLFSTSASAREHLPEYENTIETVMSEEKLVENEETVMDTIPPTSLCITSDETKISEADGNAFATVGNERFRKQDKCDNKTSNENFRSTGTIDRSKWKNINKSDISGPSDLRKYDASASSSNNLLMMRMFSKSSDTVHFLSNDVQYYGDGANEVLRTLQSNKDDPVSRGVGRFPKPEDDKIPTEDVQLRQNSPSYRNRPSRTVDFDNRRKSPPKTPDFDVVGCIKVHLPNDNSALKLKKNEHIRYQKNVIYKVDDSQSLNLPLKFGVILKSARALNKKEVELRDTGNQVYLLTFDSSKDAKNFTESDSLSSLFDSEKSTITKTLLRLLGKRSSREVLEKKGIYQNEPIFGNTLKNIYTSEQGVPSFILRTMELIERPDNITSLGLYRTSGNLATIQKIRLEVDKGNPGILDNYAKDPDVLTGSLKLFFRELKEPLMSCQTCDNLSRLMRSDKNYSKKDKDKIRTILKHLPEANSETLLALIRHLIEVVKYKDQNKMDTYNLSICWGPTVIFATDATDCTKDLVTQSTEATRLFDALLAFYIDSPEELEVRRHRLDNNRNALYAEDVKEMVASSDVGSFKLQKKNSSNTSIDMIDEGLRKAVELIENVMTAEGLYKKSGSLERSNKIVKKMTKKKIAEMEKYKFDVYELTDSLKKYMREVHEPLVTKEAVDHVNKLCDNTRCLDESVRHMVSSIIMDLPKRQSLIFIVKHLIKVMKNEPAHKVPKSEMIAIWTKVLNDHHDHRSIVESEERFSNFLATLVDVFDDTKGEPTAHKGMPDRLLNDLKNVQRDKDRVSKYDNVPDEDEGVAVLQRVDEHTKL